MDFFISPAAFCVENFEESLGGSVLAGEDLLLCLHCSAEIIGVREYPFKLMHILGCQVHSEFHSQNMEKYSWNCIRPFLPKKPTPKNWD